MTRSRSAPSVLLLFLITLSGNSITAQAADALWADLGFGIFSEGSGNATVALNWLPQEPQYHDWGATLRYNNQMRIGEILDCMFGSGCMDVLAISERAVMATRELEGGGKIVGIGLARVNLSGGLNRPEEGVWGIPLSLTWRTERWRNFGFSVGVAADLNRADSFVGVNFQIEAGIRRRQ